jgi:hypothetical protein
MRYLLCVCVCLCGSQAMAQRPAGAASFGSREAADAMIQHQMRSEAARDKRAAEDSKLRINARESEPVRTWTMQGKKMPAKLAGVSPDAVWLTLKDKKTIKVYRSSLSKTDKAWLERKVETLRKAEPEIAAKWPGKQ